VNDVIDVIFVTGWTELKEFREYVPCLPFLGRMEITSINYKTKRMFRSTLFWDIAQHMMEIPYQHFGIANWSHLQVPRNPRRIFVKLFVVLHHKRKFSPLMKNQKVYYIFS
jgi:hypothetical protein